MCKFSPPPPLFFESSSRGVVLVVLWSNNSLIRAFSHEKWDPVSSRLFMLAHVPHQGVMSHSVKTQHCWFLSCFNFSPLNRPSLPCSPSCGLGCSTHSLKEPHEKLGKFYRHPECQELRKKTHNLQNSTVFPSLHLTTQHNGGSS